MDTLTWRSTWQDVLAALPAEASQLAMATVLITGCTAGIGRRTACALARTNATIVLACRKLEKAEALAAEIAGELPSARVHCLQLELSSLASVRACAAEFSRRRAAEGWPALQCLVLNAGVIAASHVLSNEGFELTWATNHLGHFVLTKLLVDELRAGAPSRVVVVSSESHRGPLLTKRCADREELLSQVVRPGGAAHSAVRAYGSSKLANVHFAIELHRRFGSSGIAACSLHPGYAIATDIVRDYPLMSLALKYVLPAVTKTVDQGAATTVLCALLPQEQLQGRYFNNCRAAKPSSLALSEDAAAALWELSEELTASTLSKL